MQPEITDNVTAQDLDEVRLALNAFNSKFIDVNMIRSIGVFIRDEQGKKLAGLTGSTTGNWLRIDMLWVSGYTLRLTLAHYIDHHQRHYLTKEL